MLVGEGVLKFLLSESREAQARHNSYLTENFVSALEKRFEDRREATINTLIMYLSNHSSLKSDHPLQLSTKSAAVKLGIEMMNRLFKNNDKQSTNPKPSAQVTTISSTIQDRLKNSIGSVQQVNQEAPVAENFKKLFDQYDRHHVRDPQLDQLFDALCSIQPTSTQSERNFSLAAGIATPKRSKLSSKKLNAICFLKSYFLNQK